MKCMDYPRSVFVTVGWDFAFPVFSESRLEF